VAAIAAGKSAHIVLVGGALPTQNLYVNIALLVVTATLITAPLLAFTPILMREWRRAAIPTIATRMRQLSHWLECIVHDSRAVIIDAMDIPSVSRADMSSIIEGCS
jgi:hypothetical protein